MISYNGYLKGFRKSILAIGSNIFILKSKIEGYDTISGINILETEWILDEEMEYSYMRLCNNKI
jgi:hypothetical protein